MAERPRRIAILAFDNCFASEVFGLADLLRVSDNVAAHLSDAPAEPFDVSIVGAAAGQISAAGGVSLGVSPMRGSYDLLVVPGFEIEPSISFGPLLAARQREIALIKKADKRGTAIASICLGAFLLGEAGLLDGRRATTAWLFARALANRYPNAIVDRRALIVEDSGITTTAAFSSASDLAMQLIRSSAGSEIARTTGRVTLVGSARSSQAPYVDESIEAAGTGGFAPQVKSWLVAHMAEPYQLQQLAGALNVSTRTLLRRFRDETNESPLAYLQRCRVDAAKTLLESTDTPVLGVMSAVGYGDESTFRRLFASHVGMTPAAYRRAFRA